PDFPDLYTHGETLEDAFEMAQEVLEGYLVLLELQEKEIPSPTPVQELNARIKRSENVNLFVVKANTKVAKARNKQNYDRKSVTVEHYLNVLAAEENINLSKALNDLLREKLI
ncbi:TPA: type II toxin-antitoxin system HicB family antitoxin, partial [Enterococcus faecium]|nr:antitoxin HicB [Enterococcus faecium]HEN1847532.1 type II toxin-antitoxin system HicB family antitoxin [Enterococcus faecium]